MSVGSNVLGRLLLAKGLLDGIRFSSGANPDALTVARHVLAAHDASELVLAAVCDQRNCLPAKKDQGLIGYVLAIEALDKTKKSYRGYFGQLNQTRVSLKHHGVKPNIADWRNVGATTYEYLTEICRAYVDVDFENVDESVLIQDSEIKAKINEAIALADTKDYKGALEGLARALFLLFERNRALRNITVGAARAEDAIKLAAFGVNAHDYLILQEFLPRVYKGEEIPLVITWEQGSFGHQANWSDAVFSFCLKTLVHLAVRIQDAEWTPSPVPFRMVYDHKLTALQDGVQVVQQRLLREGAIGLFGPTAPVVVKTLRKGESLVGHISKKSRLPLLSLGGQEHGPETVDFIGEDTGGGRISGEIELAKIEIICVPQNDEWIRKYFPWLRDMKWEPE